MDSVKEHANKGFVPVLGIYVELSAAQILEMVWYIIKYHGINNYCGI